MLFIAHRINTIEELNDVPPEYGVEIDLRDYNDSIVLCHDPFMGGESFTEYLSHYRHSFLILNMKSAGLEEKAINLLQQNNIEDYFFLDSVMSSVVKVTEKKFINFAGRLSEFESINSLKLSQGLYSWAWIDCFTELVLSENDYKILHNQLGMRICLTSPDLLGRPSEIVLYAKQMAKLKIIPDAICSKLKNIEIWKKALDD